MYVCACVRALRAGGQREKNEGIKDINLSLWTEQHKACCHRQTQNGRCVFVRPLEMNRAHFGAALLHMPPIAGGIVYGGSAPR